MTAKQPQLKWIAYSAIAVILLHPYLIVVPRYFEAGVRPWDAFIEILWTFANIDVLAGIIAWLALLAIGVTAYFRTPILKRMSQKYIGWRGLHALLVLAFILPGTWHVLQLGRHMSWGFAACVLASLSFGLILLAQLYPERLPAKFFTSKETQS